MPTIKDVLSGLDKEKRLRRIPDSAASDMLDLSSNDYLSLAIHAEEFMEEFLQRFGDAPFSSSASRLLSARQEHHSAFEQYLSSLYGKPALIYNSGYHANVGCIGALTLPHTLFVCDKLVHASIVDGLKIGTSNFKRFPHNNIGKLNEIVEKESCNYERIIVVAESIYSMDGDEAPLHKLVEIKKRHHNVMLYIDEAHAFGVRGEKGLGIAEECSLIKDIDVIIGTFGKAGASAGAFAVCDEEIKTLLVNCARPFIFSTAIPPVNVAWSMLMTEKITGMSRQRAKLRQLSQRFNKEIERISGKSTGSSTQIIPFITGDSAKALDIAGELRKEGIIALPIRRPTVPPGGERIRFSLGADMDFDSFLLVFKILENQRYEM